MLTKIILFGFSLKFVCGNVADVVLACSLVEGVELSGLNGGSAFTRTPATLVLKDVAVAADEDLEFLTPFEPPSEPDPDAIIFEVKVSSPEIPNVDLLLHADCNDLEVMCEMSQYSAEGAQKTSGVAQFIVSVGVEAMKFSIALILQTLAVEEHSTLVQNRLGLPLSLSGTLSSEVVFLVFSQRNSVSSQLKSDAVLHCGFRQQEAQPVQEVAVEWRLQHRGKGWKVLQTKTRLDGTEQSAVVHEKRQGSSVNLTQLVAEGDASVMLAKLKVMDEGSYICSVSLGPFHAQQIIQLQLLQPPQVSLSQEKLVFKKESQTLSCHSAKYYPLDVKMEWLLLFPSDTEPTVSKDQGSLSSHRQHGDSSFSVSSHFAVPSTAVPGTKVTCRVSHRALDAPLSVSLLVESPQPSSYWWILGFLVVTVIFFFQVMK